MRATEPSRTITLRGVVEAGVSPDPVDVTIAHGLIAEVTPSTTAPAEPLLVLPGLVDVHTHLREPGGEEAETIASGARAAAAGGYTDVFAMANTEPPTDSVALVHAARRRAEGAAARVHVVAAATEGLAGRELVHVEALLAAGVTLFSDDGRCLDEEPLARELLMRLRGTRARFAEHCQSHSLAGAGIVHETIASRANAAPWPAAGEEAIVERDVRLALETGGPVHLCHLSTRGSVEIVRRAKQAGAPVTAEVTPHHLLLTDEDALRRGPRLKVNPPLRTREDTLALREGLLDGTIDAVGTDHAPHPRARKSLGWPEAAFGLTAIETALPVVTMALAQAHGGTVPWRRVVEAMSLAPARIGGLGDPRLPVLRPGAAADLCLVRSGRPWRIDASEHLSLSRNTPFDGVEVRERVVRTLLGGRTTFSLGQSSLGPDTGS